MADAQLECPPGYVSVAPGCYRAELAEPGVAWFAAEAACEADAIGVQARIAHARPLLAGSDAQPMEPATTET